MKKILIVLFGFFFMVSASAQFRLPFGKKKKDYKNIMSSTNIYEIDAFLKDAHEDDPRRSVLKPKLMELIADYIANAHPEDQSVKKLQEKLDLLKERPNTFVSYSEMQAEWKEQAIKKYKAELEAIQRGEFKAYEKPKEDANAQPTEAQKYAAEVASQNAASIAKVNNPSSKVSTLGAGRNVSLSNFTSTGMTKNEQDEFDTLMGMTASEHQAKTVKILNALFDNDPTSKDTTVLIENKSNCNIIVRMDGKNGDQFKLPVLSQSQNTIVIPKGDYHFSSVICGAKYSSEKTLNKAVSITLSNPK